MKIKHVSVLVASLLLVMPMLTQAEIQGDVNPNPNQNSCVSLQNDLQYRSTDAATGGEVSQLQDFLQSKSYLSSEPTGYFGLLTQAAVRSYQVASGILSSGYVGPITRGKIQSASCSAASTNPTPSPLPSGCRPGDLFSSTTGQRCTAAVACTMDAKQCPDGSWVGRVAPSCAFKACPNTTGADTSSPSRINVLYPTAGMSFTAGQPMRISWQAVVSANAKYNVSVTNNTVNFLAGTFSPAEAHCSASDKCYVNWTPDPTWFATLPVTVSVYDSVSRSSGTSASFMLNGPSSPSCTLTTNKSSYQLGEEVTFSWTSKNATYATFKQYNDGKDHQYVAGDKLDTSGTYSTPTNVYGNPTVTLLIYNYSSISSCSTTFSVQ